MKQRPIIMSAESVQAILDGRKTQTRRVIKKPEKWTIEKQDDELYLYEDIYGDHHNVIEKCPYGQIGDRLWVKESYTFANFGKVTIYKSDKKDQFGEDWKITASQTNSWKSPLFMPRSASRITLEITNIRVERLRDITQEDVAKEGIISVINDKVVCSNPNDTFIEQWDKLNAKRGYSWDSNPFVWVIEFRRVEK
jgi:hypothetical protein